MNDIEAKLDAVLAKLDAIKELRQTTPTSPLHGAVKITKPGKKLTPEQYQAKLNAITRAPLIYTNAGRYHNTKLTLAEKAARYEGDKLPPTAHIKLSTVARLAKLADDEADLRHRITDYYRLERKNNDAMMSHREFKAMLQAFNNHNTTYNTLRKQ